MAGSNGAADREGRARPEARPSTAWEAPWRPVSERACFLCGKQRQRAVACSDGDRIERFLKKQCPDWQTPIPPDRVTICKDCCIGALAGHRCPWWRLCWR